MAKGLAKVSTTKTGQQKSTLSSIGDWILNQWHDVSPSQAAIGTRLGLSGSDINAKTISKMVSEDPMTAALVLLEVGEAGLGMYDTLKTSFPQLADVFNTIGRKHDTVTLDTDVTDLGKFRDEFRLIREASALVGGVSRLRTLKAALELDDSVYLLHAQLSNLKEVL